MNENSDITFGHNKNNKNKSSLSQGDDCNTRKDTKYCKTKQKPNSKPTQAMGATANSRFTSIERTAARAKSPLHQVMLDVSPVLLNLGKPRMLSISFNSFHKFNKT